MEVYTHKISDSQNGDFDQKIPSFMLCLVPRYYGIFEIHKVELFLNAWIEKAYQCLTQTYRIPQKGSLKTLL